MDATAALAEAREAGYKVKITHLRWATDGHTTALVEARTARLLGLPVSEKGGSTIVELLDSDGNRSVGLALCMPTDNFDRSLGVIIALGRARKDAESVFVADDLWWAPPYDGLGV